MLALRSRLRRRRGQFPQVSATSGISRSWLSKYACGQRGKRPSYDLIQRLIGALDELDARDVIVAKPKTLGNPRCKSVAARAPRRKRS
jgi:transcriptional regulator with XRE-family HTH domain